MPEIGGTQYDEATERILGKWYDYQTVGARTRNRKFRGIIIDKKGRKIYLEVAGKNLPYLGSHGEEAFPWETYLEADRLNRIEATARKHDAESWIAFCYAILKDKYKGDFQTITTFNEIEFGVKLIKTQDYRNHMKSRSPSWLRVDLPREKVLQITCDPENI